MSPRPSMGKEPPLGRMAVWAYRRPLLVLALAGLFGVLGLWKARSLTLNADLTALLPEHFASVQALRQLEARAGATGYVVVALQGAPLPAARRYAEALAPKLEALDGIVYVDVKRPSSWTQDHLLYLAPQKDLERWADDLEEGVDRAIQRHNPLFFDLEEEDDAAPLDWKAWSGQGQLGWVRHQSSGDYYEDAQAKRLAIFVKPQANISNLDVAAGTLAAVRQVLAELEPSQFHPALRVALTGRYQKQADQKRQIQSDLGLSSTVALLLVLAYLAAYFRWWLATVLLGLPLVLSLVVTFGIVGATFGELNILTAFIGAILLGLGIDHGIHLLSSFRQRLASGAPADSALQQVFAGTGKAVSVAALTTIAGFLGLSLSEFRTFREFGIVAALGVAVVVVAYAFCLPALLALVGRFDSRPRESRFWLRGVTQSPRRWLGVGAAAIVLCVVPIGSLRFDYDFAALQDADLDSFRLDKQVNELLGYSQTPTLILTDHAAQEEAIGARLRAATAELAGASTVDMVASLADLVPTDPTAKREAMARIRSAAKRLRPEWLKDAEERQALARVLRLSSVQPVTLESLPVQLGRQFGLKPVDSEGQRQGVVMVFPSVSLADGDRVVAFAEEVRAAAGSVPVAGESVVLADILSTVRQESRSVLLVTGLGVFAALWLLQRRLRFAVLAMASASLSLLAGLGLAALLGLPLNYLNIVVIPVLFGVAVDGTVHLIEQREAGRSLTAASHAIWASLVTTALGFGALLLADHPGLRSMGLLALIGLMCNAVISLILLPAWFSVRSAVPVIAAPPQSSP